jgi:hypothetical protein
VFLVSVIVFNFWFLSIAVFLKLLVKWGAKSIRILKNEKPKSNSAATKTVKDTVRRPNLWKMDLKDQSHEFESIRDWNYI